MTPNVTDVKTQAQKEVAEELAKKAVNALKAKLRQLADAQQIVKNIEREIADLEASIADGSFVEPTFISSTAVNGGGYNGCLSGTTRQR